MLGRIATAAIAGLIATTGVSGFTQPAPQVRVNAPKKAKRGLFNDVPVPASSYRWYGTKGAGISMASQQRASKKARNVRRHKAHVRG